MRNSTLTRPRKQSFTMSAIVEDSDGLMWEVKFILFELKTKFKASAVAIPQYKSKIRIIHDINKILDLWPIEFWPEFAKGLADAVLNANAEGNDGSIQEGLF